MNVESIQVSSNELPESLNIPSSKSYANRALIIASLKKGNTTLSNITLCDDVKEMIAALKDLGLNIQENGNQLVIKNSFPACETKSEENQSIYLGEGGTTIRFLLPLISLGYNTYIVKVHPRFKLRPMETLFDQLKRLDVTLELLEAEDELCKIQGPISLDKKVSIDCSKTTQYATAFMLLQTYHEFDLVLEGLASSQLYIEMTKAVIENFKGHHHYEVPIDFSGASYFIAYGALKKSILLSNVKSIDELQGDSSIIGILKDMGIDIQLTGEGLSVSKAVNLQSFEVDARNCLDLVPTLAVLAAHAPGTSAISNIANLKYKESDRIEAIISLLKQFEIECRYENETLFINGGTLKIPPKIETIADHRLIMSGAILIKTLGSAELSPISNVTKSFPNFFELLGDA